MVFYCLQIFTKKKEGEAASEREKERSREKGSEKEEEGRERRAILGESEVSNERGRDINNATLAAKCNLFETIVMGHN